MSGCRPQTQIDALALRPSLARMHSRTRALGRHGPLFLFDLYALFDTSPDILVHLLVCILSRARPVLHAKVGVGVTVPVAVPVCTIYRT
eukprot:6737000-Prymnesium_polylepis.1